jgi:hypothetical protein
MIRSRLGLKALGMCALVLGLMAVWAGAAQAENTGGSWTYELAGALKTFEGVLAEPSIGGELEPGEAVLHAEVLGGTKLLYDCAELKVVEGKLKANGVVLGRLVFHSCKTLLNGATSANCAPNAKGIHPGLIETNLIKGQMLLHKLASGAVDKIVVAEPDEVGGSFAFVESSAACSIGLKVLIGGKFAIQDQQPSTHLEVHLINEFLPLTDLFVISKTAEHKAEILGSAKAFLTGAHATYKWAGLWL